ncbi:hypothetical protein [Paenarthrobacter ureafaciens]|uniref:hypothetical protein n=1 Tax=Paenarthrobacter ureafaciens TaxID=37931 RepID=UPI0015BE8236|nr:hypothetical protein [Paenarthrobacter ureafaciens]
MAGVSKHRGRHVSVKDLVDVGQFVLNCFLAVFTMWLFVQGQRDRRRIGEDRRKEQAAKVSMLLNQPHTKVQGKPGTEPSWQPFTQFLEIFNDSDVGVTGVKVLHQVPNPTDKGWSLDLPPRSPSWNDLPPHEWKLLDLVDDPLPTVIPYLGGGELERVYCEGRQLSTHGLELYFTDGAGLSWVRTIWDGKLWPNNQHSDSWWNVIFQRLTVLPVLGKVFNLPIQYAHRRLRKTAPRIPPSARFARFLWGHAPGPTPEPEPWRRPSNFPARDWPYEGMVWWAYFQRENPRSPKTSKVAA